MGKAQWSTLSKRTAGKPLPSPEESSSQDVRIGVGFRDIWRFLSGCKPWLLSTYQVWPFAFLPIKKLDFMGSIRSDQCQLRNYTEKPNGQGDSAHSQRKRSHVWANQFKSQKF